MHTGFRFLISLIVLFFFEEGGRRKEEGEYFLNPDTHNLGVIIYFGC